MIHTITPALEVRALTIAYQQVNAVHDVTFSVAPGTFCGLIGANGTGKTTLLEGILELRAVHDTSVVRFFGSPFASVRARVAYVSQRLAVDWDFPLTVYDMVAMGRIVHQRWGGWTSSGDKKIIEEALDQVGLTQYANVPIGRLSGGQQQRVCIARALAQHADFYVLDEPFAAVDDATEKMLLQLLRAQVDAGKTVLMVHHDLQAVDRVCDQVVELARVDETGGSTLKRSHRIAPMQPPISPSIVYER